MSLYALFLREHVLLAAHQGKTTKPVDIVIWNNLRMIWRQLWIGLIAFVPLYTLCRRFYTLFSQELILITAHQGQTRHQNNLEQD